MDGVKQMTQFQLTELHECSVEENGDDQDGHEMLAITRLWVNYIVNGIETPISIPEWEYVFCF